LKNRVIHKSKRKNTQIEVMPKRSSKSQKKKKKKMEGGESKDKGRKKKNQGDIEGPNTLQRLEERGDPEASFEKNKTRRLHSQENAGGREGHEDRNGTKRKGSVAWHSSINQRKVEK